MRDLIRPLLFTAGLMFLAALSAVAAHLGAAWGSLLARDAGATARSVAACAGGIAMLAPCCAFATWFYIPRGVRWYRRGA